MSVQITPNWYVRGKADALAGRPRHSDMYMTEHQVMLYDCGYDAGLLEVARDNSTDGPGATSRGSHRPAG